MQSAHRDKRHCLGHVSSPSKPTPPSANEIKRTPRMVDSLREEALARQIVGLHLKNDEQLRNPFETTTAITPTKSLQHAFPHLDGPHDHRSHPMSRPQTSVPPRNPTTTLPPAKQQSRIPKSAISDMLPYCTNGAPLTEAQVIALSDLAGSLKEVMLLALQAKMDERVATDLVRAVGQEAADGIVEFFSDEFEV